MTNIETAGKHAGSLTQWVPLRLISYALALLATAILATIVTRLLVPPNPSPWHQLVIVKNVLLPVAMMCIYALLVRRMEHRAATEVYLRPGLSKLFLGTLVGIALMGILILAFWTIGFAQIATGAGLRGLVRGVLNPLVTAIGEELLFRVVLFGLLEEMLGTTSALILSASVFGLAHAGNAGATPLAIIDIALLGVVQAQAYALSRSIWLPVGIHAGWNFAQEYLFGVPDSGVREPDSILKTTLSGPDLISGGSFGPEASITVLVLLVVTSIIFGILVRRHGAWISNRLRLRPRHSCAL